MPVANVTVLDQNGNMLSKAPGEADSDGLDPKQLKYVEEFQRMVATRVESILVPLVGRDNVRAEVTADIDFSRQEQAAEIYKPNQNTTDAAVRSMQTSESAVPGAATAGVPGALTNQPPGVASAPLTTPPGQPAAPATAMTANQRRDATMNYEVDKTIRYTAQPMGGVKRVSTAVVVNYKKTTDAKGKESWKPLSAAEKAQIEALVKEAMGFNAERGDTLNVVNSRFTIEAVDVPPPMPMWKAPDNIAMAKDIGQYVLLGVASLLIWLKVVRPMSRRLALASQQKEAEAQLKANAEAAAAADEESAVSHHLRLPALTHDQKLLTARNMAQTDPKAVASVLKGWVNQNG
jgi:flagellar M-ring protein FliF